MNINVQEKVALPSCLTMMRPEEILQHGPSKLYVDDFLWYSGKLGAIAAYTPNQEDVKDHFGVFRGVDQVESFAQGTAVAACTLLECQKKGVSVEALREKWNVAFTGVGGVKLNHFIREGDVFISVAKIDFYRFRQMIVNGCTYRVPKEFDLKAFFEDYSDEDFLSDQLPDSFQPIGEIERLAVMVLPKDKFKH